MSDLSDDAKSRLNKEHAKGRMDQAGGAFDEIKGKVKKNVGDAFGDRSMQAEGAAEKWPARPASTPPAPAPPPPIRPRTSSTATTDLVAR